MSLKKLYQIQPGGTHHFYSCSLLFEPFATGKASVTDVVFWLWYQRGLHCVGALLCALHPVFLLLNLKPSLFLALSIHLRCDWYKPAFPPPPVFITDITPVKWDSHSSSSRPQISSVNILGLGLLILSEQNLAQQMLKAEEGREVRRGESRMQDLVYSKKNCLVWLWNKKLDGYSSLLADNEVTFSWLLGQLNTHITSWSQVNNLFFQRSFLQ